jgi:tetratricopeptide (TPR) repeat protein
MAFGARGKILLRKRDPVRAESDLEKACRLGPPRAEHLYWLGIVRSRSPSSKKRATAVHLWEKAVRADERYDAAFYRLGLVYQDQGRLKEAAHCFSSAYSLRPRQQMSLLKLSEVYSKTKQFSLAYQSRGAYYRKRGALDQAVEQFRARINVDPHNEQTYIELATTLARENRRAEAIDVLEKGLTFAESKSDLYYLLASTYYDSKDLKKAKDALETMMRLYQDNADSAMRMLAQIAWDERDRDKSERILKKAIRLRPDEAENHYLLGIIYMRRLGKGNRLPLAIKEFERCIELDPRNTQAVYRLGIAYQRAQRWEEAGAQFRAAISIDPSFASPYLNLYKVYRKLNKSTGHLRRLYDEYEESKSEMETLIMRNRARQYDTEATLKLGREYLRNGLINEGEERLVRLVQLAPNSPRAH